MFELLLDAGFAADQSAAPAPRSSPWTMLDEGTAQRTALRSAMNWPSLGATSTPGSDLDTSTVNLSAALTTKLDRSLDVYADMILNPAFPAGDFERLQSTSYSQDRPGEDAADSDGAARFAQSSCTAPATPTPSR